MERSKRPSTANDFRKCGTISVGSVPIISPRKTQIDRREPTPSFSRGHLTKRLVERAGGAAKRAQATLCFAERLFERLPEDDGISSAV